MGKRRRLRQFVGRNFLTRITRITLGGSRTRGARCILNGGCLSTLGRVANVPKQPLVAQEATGSGFLDFGVSRPR